MRHNDAGVRVRLEGGPGLFGFVPADYVTDDVLPTDPITGQVRAWVGARPYVMVLYALCFVFCAFLLVVSPCLS